MAHMKRLAIPPTWPLEKRSATFAPRPYPSKSFRVALPLGIVLRDVLGIVATMKEVSWLLHHNIITLNGKRVSDRKQVMGLFDVITIPGVGPYRMIFNETGKLTLHEVGEQDAFWKPVRIEGFTYLKGGKLQVNGFQGENYLIAEKNDLKVGDALIVSWQESSKAQVVGYLPLQEQVSVFVVGGKKAGLYGTIMKLEDGLVHIKDQEGEEVVVLRQYVYPYLSAFDQKAIKPLHGGTKDISSSKKTTPKKEEKQAEEKEAPEEKRASEKKTKASKKPAQTAEAKK